MLTHLVGITDITEELLNDLSAGKFVAQWDEEISKMANGETKMKRISKRCKIAESDWNDSLPGGLADKKNPKEFDQEQLMKGIHVEFEHTDDILTAMEIAMDHLTEDKDYYKKLEKIEKDH
jgi:hypothetical protein